MSEEKTLKTAAELEAEEQAQIREETESYFLDATQNYPEPYYMLEYNGVSFSTLGGIQALSGQKKNGKTFVLAQLMAAILGTDIEKSRTEECLPGLRVPERTIDYLGHLPTVLYVDTEMEKLNSAKVLRRVHYLCGWPLDQPCNRFHVLWLRSVTDVKDNQGNIKERAYKKRYRLIRQAIEILNPDAVFIDGIRDIIGDFNDNAESAALVGELMAIAEKRHICIWNTLHMNPRPGNDDDSKMRGHLGTELGNKITDTLVSIKSKDTNGVVFTVKQQDARGKDMDDWKFEVTDEAGQLGIPKIVGNAGDSKRVEPISDDPAVIRGWIEEAMKTYTWPMTKSDIKKTVFGQIGGIKNHGRQQADLQVAINMKYLVESTLRAGNGGYMLQPPDIDEMPF